MQLAATPGSSGACSFIVQCRWHGHFLWRASLLAALWVFHSLSELLHYLVSLKGYTLSNEVWLSALDGSGCSLYLLPLYPLNLFIAYQPILPLLLLSLIILDIKFLIIVWFLFPNWPITNGERISVLEWSSGTNPQRWDLGICLFGSLVSKTVLSSLVIGNRMLVTLCMQ